MVIAAVVESAYDTKDLMNGYSVALYKSMPTWRFYYNKALLNTAKDLGAGVISEVVNKSTSKLKEKAGEEFDKLIDSTNAYVEGSVQNITESIILYFQVPIQQLLLRAISNAEADTINTLEESKKIIRQGFEDLKQELNEQKSKLVGVDGSSPLVIEAKLKVLEVFNTDAAIDELADMANKIIQAEQDEVSNVSKELEDRVKQYFTERKDKIVQNINSIIDEGKLKAKLKEEINKAIDEAGDNVQAGLNKALNKFADKLDGSIPKDANSLSEFDANRASLLSMQRDTDEGINPVIETKEKVVIDGYEFMRVTGKFEIFNKESKEIVKERKYIAYFYNAIDPSLELDKRLNVDTFTNYMYYWCEGYAKDTEGKDFDLVIETADKIMSTFKLNDEQREYLKSLK